MEFCPDCGVGLTPCSETSAATARWRCETCRVIHRDYPRIMLTCFVSCADKLLWIQRRLEPQAGFWAIPGGFMEAGETTAEGAARELWEEAGIRLPPESLAFYMTGTITFINQVYIAYRVEVPTPHCTPGEEAIDAAFYTRKECPWDRVAYPEVNNSILRAYDDLERGQFGVYQAEMTAQDYRLVEVGQR